MVPEKRTAEHSKERTRFFVNNGLSVVMLGLFLCFWLGQALSGHAYYNEERQSRGEPPMAMSAYLHSGHFLAATAENWESEFLQMSAYVVFTIFLYQRGSSESKTPGKREAVDRDPRLARNRRNAPWPVRDGGPAVLWLYSNSLSLALGLLFVVSFALHASGGARAFSEELLAEGQPAVDALHYLGSSRFWFESFQNWQSEFLSIGVMVILSVFLRQRGSPESKPVDAPHYETGGD